MSLIKLVAMIDFRSRGFRIQFSGLLIKVLGCSVNNDGYIGMPCNSFGKLNRISQNPFFLVLGLPKTVEESKFS